MESPADLAPAEPSLAPPAMQTLRAVGALVLREMGSTYGQSPGGYLWALISPLGSIMLLSFAFSLMLMLPPLGASFLLFYATGFLVFNLYNQLSSRIGMALRYSRPLLTYPRVTWLDAVIARFLLNTLVWLVVACIVILGMFAFVEAPARLEVWPIFLGVTMAAVLGLGVGIMNCLLIGFFPVWERIWGIVSTPLMLASGVLFLYDGLAEKVRDILWWNPLAHAVALTRSGFYHSYNPTWVSLIYGYLVGLLLILFGLVFLRSGYRATFEK